MSLFGKWHSNQRVLNIALESRQYGRYTDSYKTPQQYDHWEKAIESYEEGAYLQAYECFLQYLFDDYQNNVHFHREKGKLQFTLIQGSKRILGIATVQKVEAYALVAQAEELPEDLMTRLLERNTGLQYARFCLEENNQLGVRFDTSSLDGSPYKLYHALKELAISADKLDDLLLDSYTVLTPVQDVPVQTISPEQKQVKHQYLTTNTEAVLQYQAENEDFVEQFPSAYSYLMLSLCYRLDYLLQPEGVMMETLERINRMFFNGHFPTAKVVNAYIKEEMTDLIQRPKEAFYKEFYKVSATFGITPPISINKVVEIIQGELDQRRWYEENDHPEIVLAISRYLAGYCLFNYALPKLMKELFHLLYLVTEYDYFSALGHKIPFMRKGKIQEKILIKQLRLTLEANRQEENVIEACVQTINTSNVIAFSSSFLQMMCLLKD